MRNDDSKPGVAAADALRERLEYHDRKRATAMRRAFPGWEDTTDPDMAAVRRSNRSYRSAHIRSSVRAMLRLALAGAVGFALGIAIGHMT